jgi:MtN3 and saliva related transmembrane protein
MGKKEIMELFGYISAICFFIGYIPQLWRTYRLKSVDDISMWMWLVTLLAYVSGLIYGFQLNKLPLIISYLLGISCVVTMLSMYFTYRDVGKDRIRRLVRNFIKESRKGIRDE